MITNLDDESVTRIENFVKDYCLKFKGPRDIVLDFKEELRSNIIMNVIDLANQGIPSKDALQKVLDNFEVESINEFEVSSVFTTKKIILGWLLAICIIIALVSISSIAFYYYQRDQISNEFEKFNKQMLYYIESQPDMERVPDELYKQMINVVDHNRYIHSGWIRIRDNGALATDQYEFSYNSDRILKSNILGYDIFGAISIINPQKKNALEVRFLHWNVSEKVFLFGITLLAIYWLLFTLWGVINLRYIMYKGYLPIIVILATNFIGFLVLWQYSIKNKTFK